MLHSHHKSKKLCLILEFLERYLKSVQKYLSQNRVSGLSTSTVEFTSSTIIITIKSIIDFSYEIINNDTYKIVLLLMSPQAVV